LKPKLLVWLVVLGAVLTAFGAWMFLPKPLEVSLAKPQTTFSFWVGQHDIRVVLKPLQSGDNGDVAVLIFKNGSLLQTLRSRFGYDTLQSQPPIWVRYIWFDGDVLPDLHLELHSSAVVVQSGNGQVVSL
jgi:hypothetical protein